MVFCNLISAVIPIFFLIVGITFAFQISIVTERTGRFLPALEPHFKKVHV